MAEKEAGQDQKMKFGPKAPVVKGTTEGKGPRKASMASYMLGGARPSPEVQQMEVMSLLVESMKSLQRQISDPRHSCNLATGCCWYSLWWLISPRPPMFGGKR